jgi:NAD(P)H dehydrogenase (quinone)
MAKVMVIYYSKTGNTRKLAELIAEGAREVSGVEVEMIELPGGDMAAVAAADGYAIGSPDYFSYPAGHVKTFFDEALALKEQLSGKPSVAFCTHGGGGRALAPLEKLSEALGLRHAVPGVICAGAPADKAAEDARAAGRSLGQAAAGS